MITNKADIGGFKILFLLLTVAFYIVKALISTKKKIEVVKTPPSKKKIEPASDTYVFESNTNNYDDNNQYSNTSSTDHRLKRTTFTSIESAHSSIDKNEVHQLQSNIHQVTGKLKPIESEPQFDWKSAFVASLVFDKKYYY